MKGALERQGLTRIGRMICRACGMDKPESSFQVKGKSVDGLTIRRGTCRACRKR